MMVIDGKTTAEDNMERVRRFVTPAGPSAFDSSLDWREHIGAAAWGRSQYRRHRPLFQRLVAGAAPVQSVGVEVPVEFVGRETASPHDP